MKLDQADPSITREALPMPAPPIAHPDATLPPTPSSLVPLAIRGTAAGRVARAIVVVDNSIVPSDAFAPVTARFIGPDLSDTDLTTLAGAVADVARKAGYPFATATIPVQDMSNGVLHVTLDEGRINAVRVLGAVNPLADRMLTEALVTGRPVTRREVDRAITLVGDLPGVTVKESRYVRQDGFGILLVTVAQDHASAYLQLDNRGSKEVGPVRSTILANVRGVARAGDELGALVSNTPFMPQEFFFARARYTAPVDLAGSVVSLSASYGHTRPGGFLRSLDVVGASVDVALAYTRPVLRDRRHGLWAALELRGLGSDQTLLGAPLRRDRLATLTASVSGTMVAGPGTLHGTVAVVDGLPIAGVTHEGDRLASRDDGDARFVTWGYALDWSTRFAGRFGFALATEGQVASRPLLATAELGLGGPGFGRAYDYAERTGDDGVLGSAELRADAGRIVPGLLDRLQLYGFVDGGYVDNLRDGFGGGALLSTGTGARLGNRFLDSAVEVAFPINADRFDTRNRDPRISFRVSRAF